MNRLGSTSKQNVGLGGAMGLGGVGFQIEVTTPSAGGDRDPWRVLLAKRRGSSQGSRNKYLLGPSKESIKDQL